MLSTRISSAAITLLVTAASRSDAFLTPLQPNAIRRQKRFISTTVELKAESSNDARKNVFGSSNEKEQQTYNRRQNVLFYKTMPNTEEGAEFSQVVQSVAGNTTSDIINDETSPPLEFTLKVPTTDMPKDMMGLEEDFIDREESSQNFNENSVELRSAVERPKLQVLKDIIAEKVGTVSADRVAFPEYSSGEVNRMFSNLKYKEETTSDKNAVTKAMHAPGSILGAASLVAGTTIGAGVLALPSVAAPVGFLPSSAGLTMAWLYMVGSGLIIAELCINRIGETGRPGLGLLDLYNSLLGKKWGLAGTVPYFFLHYAMMVAYIAQGGSNLGSFLSEADLFSSTQFGNVASSIPGINQILFASCTGLPLFFAKPSSMEKFNNLLVGGIVATFLTLIGVGAGTADYSALVSPENQHPEGLLNAFPIFFLSLVYQNVVPTIVTQLEGDRTKIVKSILLGSFVPFAMFLLWNAVILGNVLNTPHDHVVELLSSGNIDPIALLQSGAHAGGATLTTLVGIFSELAVVTSLIGFVYGLSDAWRDTLGIQTSGQNYDKWKPLLFGGIFVPPLLLSIADPDIFLEALSYGGAFGVSTLFLVLPPIMAWKTRYGEANRDSPITTLPIVPGGKLTLASMWKAAGTLILEQGAEKVGLIDWVREHVLSNFFG